MGRSFASRFLENLLVILLCGTVDLCIWGCKGSVITCNSHISKDILWAVLPGDPQPFLLHPADTSRFLFLSF